MPDTQREQALLQRSIYGATGIACLSVAFGFITSSQSILFDGMYAVLDAFLSGLALFVLRLVGKIPVVAVSNTGFGMWSLWCWC